jgi:predicted MFS family arabinose efflux permease
MTVQTTFEDGAVRREAPAWGAVFALTLCVAALIASEFMPVSLLTPVAAELHITQGQAGQAIGISGIFAVLASLFISRATSGIDRRIILLSLTVLMIASGLIVALAPNQVIFMAGRALIGIVIGGFWSMSAATAMRLVPESEVPRALAIFNGGNALATTIAAPLGSFLGQYIGWRGAFFSVVPLAALALAWQFLTLPSMPTGNDSRRGSVFGIVGMPKVGLGMVAVAFFFMGQFALFTYVRPFLEAVAHVNVSTLSSLLLIMGIAGLLGTSFIGTLLKTRLYVLLIGMPLVMALIATGLILLGGSIATVASLLAGWGLIGTAAPVGWWTWLSKMLPDDAERGGGLMVAIIQLAITFGATIGGFFYDGSGYQGTFGVSAIILCASAIMAYFVWRATSRPHKDEAAIDSPALHT